MQPPPFTARVLRLASKDSLVVSSEPEDCYVRKTGEIVRILTKVIMPFFLVFYK